MPDLDSYLVRHALTVARENGYAEVQVSTEDSSFAAILDPKKPAKKSAVGGPPVPDGHPEQEFKFVKSTLVGYLEALKIGVGDDIVKGHPAAVVSALGLANDIESQVSGEVVEILVAEGDPVEYGQPLAKVIPQ